MADGIIPVELYPITIYLCAFDYMTVILYASLNNLLLKESALSNVLFLRAIIMRLFY